MKTMHKSLITFIVILIATDAVVNSCRRRRRSGPKSQPVQGGQSDGKCGQRFNMSRRAFNHMNDHRAARGLRRLNWDQHTYDLCQQHNQYQAGQGRISHDGFQERTTQLGGRAFENVAMNSAQDNVPYRFFNQWHHSPGHNKNMLEISVNSGAVAIWYDCNSRSFYATNMNIKR